MSDLDTIARLVRELGATSGPGRREVLDELVPHVYEELKSLSRVRRKGWRGFDDPGTTSLVHEVYTRLASQKDPRYTDKGQLFAVASKAMRSILVDNARWHRRGKRGGDAAQVPLSDGMLVSESRPEELLGLDRALDELEASNPELVRLVELRCFGGLTNDELAEALGVSLATVKRRWSLARARLRLSLGAGGAETVQGWETETETETAEPS